MKPIEIKIPVWGVIVTSLVLIGAIVGITLLVSKNKKITYYKSKVDSIQIASSIIIKQKEDTIQYLTAVIEQKNIQLTVSKQNIAAIKRKLDAIPVEVSKYTPNEIYDKILDYVDEKTDSSEYPFSGNQISDIYREHLYIDQQQDLINEYEFYIIDLMSGIDVRDKGLNEYKKLGELKNKMLEESNKRCDILEQDLLKQTKRKKIWRTLTPIGTGVGIVVGLLL